MAPSDAQAANRLGRALFYIDRRREAFEEFQAAAKLSDEVPAAEVSMALLFEREKDSDRAARFIARAVEMAPKSYSTRIGVAQWCWDTGRIGELSQHADAALAINASDPAAHRFRGLAAVAQGDAETAEKHFEAALAGDPGDYLSSDHLALVLAENSDVQRRKRALDLATLAARKFPGRNDPIITLAWVQLSQGDASTANRTLRGVDWRRSLSRDSAYRAAQIAAAAGDTASAKKLMQTALESAGPFLNKRQAEKLLNQWTAASKTPGKS
jgi:tetratricopeptide (TPR) repeat protein